MFWEQMKRLTFLANERQTPSEDVHEVGEPVGMRGRVELPDVHDVALVFQDGGFVVIDIEVVRGREDGHDGGETGSLRLPIHAVTRILGFMGSDDGEEIVALEELACSLICEEVRATPNVIVDEAV